MVAITVILAAVIGAFVLEIGDQQETAPNTSFDSEEMTKTLTPPFNAAEPSKPMTWRAVELNHAGGGVIDYKDLNVKVEGNESTYNMEFVQNEGGSDWAHPYGGGDDVEIHPTLPITQPTVVAAVQNTCPTVNEVCEMASGESIRVMFYGQVSYESAFSKSNDDQDRAEFGVWASGSDPASQNITSVRFNCGSGCGHTLQNIQQGDSTRLVWTASSGGKTQTLFKYEVQGAR